MELIVGKKKSGKTEYILSKMKEIREKTNSQIYIIVPDQYTNMYERLLTEKLSKGTLMNVEVISFSRLADISLKNSKYSHYRYIDESGKNIIIADILKNLELDFFKKDSSQIKAISKSISNFKSYNISPNEILEKIKDENEVLLELKLRDLDKIYNEYENFLSSEYLDQEDKIKILFESMNEDTFLKDSYVFMEKFQSLEKRQYDIFKKISLYAKDVFVSILSDDIKQNEENELDIFKESKKTALNILKILEDVKKEKFQNGEDIDLKYIYLKNNYNFSNEIKVLEKEFPNIFIGKDILSEDEKKITEKKISDIMFLSFEDNFKEIKYVAIDILNKLNNGYKPKDILVISNNLSEEKENIEEIFSKYGINTNISKEKNILSNVLIQYILDILKAAYFKNSEDILNLLKLNILEIQNIEELESLEKYITKWNISGYKWELEWKNIDKNANFEEIIKLKTEILNILNELKKRLDETKTGKEKLIEIYKHLEKNNVFKKVLSEIKSQEIKNQYMAVTNILNNVFDEIAYIYEKKDISLENLIYILEESFSNNNLKEVPNTLNGIDVRDILDTAGNKKIIYIMNSEEGLLPVLNENKSIISEEEKEVFKKIGIDFLKNKVEQDFNFELKFYDSIFSAEDKIIFTYSKKDIFGKTKRRTIYFKKIQNIFKEFKEKNIYDEDINFLENINKIFKNANKEKKLKEYAYIEYAKYLNGENITKEAKEIIKYFKDKGFFEKIEEQILSKNEEKNLNKDLTQKIYKGKLKTSISRLESYSLCPFMYQIKYIIKAKEKEEYSIKPFDTGNFIHTFLEIFINNVKDEIEKYKRILDNKPIYDIDNSAEKINYLNMLKEKIKLSIQSAFDTDKYQILKNEKKFEILSLKLLGILEKSALVIAESLRLSEFKVYKTEYEINGKILENIYIKGIIDRIDVFEEDGKKFFRIIDYKSSEKKITPKEIYSGINLQMPVYANLIEKMEKSENVGLLYFATEEKKIDKKIEKENLNKEIIKKYKMDGIVLKDEEILKQMDKTLISNKEADFIPVKYKVNGEITSNLKVIEKESFEKLLEDIEKILIRISNEILNGNINIYPLEGACKFCKYSNICMIDKSKNKFRKYKNIKKWD